MASASATVAAAIAGFTTGSAPTPTPTPAPAPALPVATGDPITYPRPNGELYYAREILPGLNDVEFLRQCRGATLAENLYVLLYSAPGTGKTALVEAAFPDAVTISGDFDTTTDDFVGTQVQNPDGTYSWVDGPLIEAAEAGRPLFIDEIALIPSGVLAVIYPLMDGRGEIRIKQNPARGIVRSQPGFYVCGAYNPHVPGARLSEALLDRFRQKMEATSDLDLAGSLGVNRKLITVTEHLRERVAQGTCSWEPQMRALLAFRDVEARFNLGVALANFIASAPEDDRPQVADAVSRTFGGAVMPLRQGGQARHSA
jgi:hypothetical protein